MSGSIDAHIGVAGIAGIDDPPAELLSERIDQLLFLFRGGAVGTEKNGVSAAVNYRQNRCNTGVVQIAVSEDGKFGYVKGYRHAHSIMQYACPGIDKALISFE